MQPLHVDAHAILNAVQYTLLTVVLCVLVNREVCVGINRHVRAAVLLYCVYLVITARIGYISLFRDTVIFSSLKPHGGMQCTAGREALLKQCVALKKAVFEGSDYKVLLKECFGALLDNFDWTAGCVLATLLETLHNDEYAEMKRVLDLVRFPVKKSVCIAGNRL